MQLHLSEQLQAHVERLIAIREYGRQSKVYTRAAEVSIINKLSGEEQALVMAAVVAAERSPLSGNGGAR